MAFNTLCVLDGANLPAQFSYDYPEFMKRLNLIQTEASVVVQTAGIVLLDSFINWECLAACPSEFFTIFQAKFHNALHPTMNFTGYWGDSYTVKFHRLDQPDVHSRLFDITGVFQVISVSAFSNVSDY